MTPLPFFIFLGLSHSVYYCEIGNFNEQVCPYEKLVEKQQELNQCLNQQEGLWHFTKVLINPKGSPSDLISKRCSLRPHLDNCMDLWMDLVKECVNPDDLKGLEVWKKIDSEIIDYVCKNPTEVLSSLFAKSCQGQGLGKALTECSLSLNISAPFYDVSKVRQSCSQIEEMENCVFNKLSLYCPKNVIDTTTPLLHIVKTNLCN